MTHMMPGDASRCSLLHPCGGGVFDLFRVLSGAQGKSARMVA
jgi:hypothetical protein